MSKKEISCENVFRFAQWKLALKVGDFHVYIIIDIMAPEPLRNNIGLTIRWYRFPPYTDAIPELICHCSYRKNIFEVYIICYLDKLALYGDQFAYNENVCSIQCLFVCYNTDFHHKNELVVLGLQKKKNILLSLHTIAWSCTILYIPIKSFKSNTPVPLRQPTSMEW